MKADQKLLKLWKAMESHGNPQELILDQPHRTLYHPQVARELRGHALFGAVFNGSPAEMGIDFRAASEVEASDGRPLVLLFKPKEKLSCKMGVLETPGAFPKAPCSWKW